MFKVQSKDGRKTFVYDPQRDLQNVALLDDNSWMAGFNPASLTDMEYVLQSEFDGVVLKQQFEAEGIELGKIYLLAVMRAVLPDMKEFFHDRAMLEEVRYVTELFHLLNQGKTNINDLLKDVGANSKVLKTYIHEGHYPISRLFDIRHLAKVFNRGQLEELFGTGKIKKWIHLALLADYEVLVAFINDAKYPAKLKQNVLSLFVEEVNDLKQDFVEDTFSQFRKTAEHDLEVEWPKYRTFTEVHDDISRIYNRLKHQNVIYKPEQQIEIETPRFKIKTPVDRYELIEWGQNMRNCIASYHEFFASKKGHLLLVHDKEEDKSYNLQLEQGSVLQFSGKVNSGVDAKVRSAVYDVLKKHKLIEV